MSYKITIEKKTQVKETGRTEYQKVGEEEYKGDFSGEIKTRGIYDYISAPDHIVTKTTEVLVQEVDDLDLTTVIKAINGIQ